MSTEDIWIKKKGSPLINLSKIKGITKEGPWIRFWSGFGEDEFTSWIFVSTREAEEAFARIEQLFPFPPSRCF